jgi:flavin-dependent dehydrogenase
MSFDTDVFIVGGGPAGLAAGIAARQKGLRAIVADAARPPIDKACGEGLMPDARAAAARIGIEIPANAGFEFRGIRFAGPRNSVAAAFPEGAGLGVRRTVLHPLLADCASQAGVELSWGIPVTGIGTHTVTLGQTPVRTRWIVGADGGQSLLRRWAGLEGFRRQTRRFGFRRHFRIAPWTDCMEIHWGEGCQFYVTPVSDDEVCLVLMSRSPHLRIEDALPAFPELRHRLGDAAVTTPERGSLAATCRLKTVARGHVALIGDASGTVDAITGDGLCLAFQQAAALASALESGDLDRYAAAHSRLSRRPAFMAGFMLTLDRWPRLRHRALAALSARPDLFANILAMHVGKLSLPAFARTGAQLGWELTIA